MKSKKLRQRYTEILEYRKKRLHESFRQGINEAVEKMAAETGEDPALCRLAFMIQLEDQSAWMAILPSNH